METEGGREGAREWKETMAISSAKWRLYKMQFCWYLNNYRLYIPPLNCGMGLVIKLCKCGNISLSFLSDLLKLLENLVSPDCCLPGSELAVREMQARYSPAQPVSSLCTVLSANSVYSGWKMSGRLCSCLTREKVAVVHSQVPALPADCKQSENCLYNCLPQSGWLASLINCSKSAPPALQQRPERWAFSHV